MVHLNPYGGKNLKGFETSRLKLTGTCAEVNCTHHVVNAVGCAYIQIYAIVSPLELGNIYARSMSQFITLYVHINFHLFQS